VADEALGMGVVGGGQDAGALGLDGCGVAVVDVSGGVQAEPAVAVLVVIPAEEALAVRTGVLERGEPGGKIWPVFQGLELCFGIRVAVAHMRAGVRLGDTEIGEQQSGRLRGH
jgi:hypothetical protein